MFPDPGPTDPCADTSGCTIVVTATPNPTEPPEDIWIGGAGPFFGDPTGGPSIDKHGIILRARQTLVNALTDDPDCLQFLGRYGANVLGTLKSIPISHDYLSGGIGGPHITGKTNASWNPMPGEQVPSNPSIVINDNGFFFTNPNNLAFQGPFLLHELGHATGVLLPEGQVNDAAATAALEARNEEAFKRNCDKTLSSLAKK